MGTRDFEELEQIHNHRHNKHHQYEQQHQLLQEQQDHRLNYQNHHNQPHHQLQQQQEHQHTTNSNHSNERRQVGLMPTQGNDAPYIRSSSRASKRTRLERTSYLMATGHLDVEENKQLKSGDNASDGIKHSSDKSMKQNNANSSHGSLLATTTPLSIRPAGDQTLLMGSGSSSFTTLPTMNPFDTHDSIFVHNNFKMPKSTRQANKKERGQFRQTYTEVAMPMKTSPAFEYILKDDRRRQRRCYLWLIYSLMVTICLALIIFSSAQVVLRYQRGHY